MAEQIPWELMRHNINIFAHDTAGIIQFAVPHIDIAAFNSKSSELAKLETEIVQIAYSIGGIHELFSDFRTRETPPKNLEETLTRYRRLLRKRNEKMKIVLGKIKSFRKKNIGKLDKESIDSLNKGIELLQQGLTQFSADKLGRKVHARTRPQNIFSFLRSFSQQRFVDREGNQVKVIVRGKDIGKANFDERLLWRVVYNSVTDALNHTPGRPIYVTLNKRNGDVKINVTNQGTKLRPSEIAKIGRVRFTRAWHDPKRGYGKISTRLLTEAQGGTFKAGNSRIGPMLTITLPRRTRRR